MVNPEIINERLRQMDENIVLLDELKATPFEKFCNDPKIYKLAERCLELCIQCILDICHHIIVEKNWSRPKNNKEAILTISQQGVIPSDFANRILPMAGLRNILVHEYLTVDNELIYKHLQDTADFRQFAKLILKYLKSA